MPNLLHHFSNQKFTIPLFSGLIKLNKKMIRYQENNPFLDGIFAPVSKEVEITNLKVTGKIPKELNGLLLRSGPNPFEVENPAVYNWFVGDGMVHGLKLQNGQAVWYKNKYIGTHKINQKLGRAKIKGQPRGVADISNTNLMGHAGKIWSLVEAGQYPIALDFDLNSQSYGLFNSRDKFGFTAHPHKDPETGELHAICYDVVNLTQIFYQVIDTQGKVKKRIEIPVQHGPMMHDCAITQNYVIIFDLPITFSLKNIAKGAEFPYAWNSKHQARLGLLPKTANSAHEIQWFNVDPCFIFHSCNAYELDNGDVILDSAVHGTSFENSIQGPVDEQTIKFERWTMHKKTSQITRQVISTIPQEFPRIDERLTGKPYRYAYAISLGDDGETVKPGNIKPNKLLRHDLKTNETIEYSYGEKYGSGEVIFVPKSDTSREDEGWLISYVHHLENKATQVVILDAQNIGQEPLAIIDLSVRVPAGFHTNWVPHE